MNRIVLDARTAVEHFPGIGRYVANVTGALQHVEPDLDLALLRDSPVRFAWGATARQTYVVYQEAYATRRH